MKLPCPVRYLALVTTFVCGSAQAATLTQTVTGSLLGNQTLPQFNPALGTLTGVNFRLTSSASGLTNIIGVFIPATPGVPPFLPPTPAGCVVGGSIVTYTVAGYLNNLNFTTQDILFATGTPPACTVSGAFAETINIGPSAGLGALANYVGLGTMPFSFTIANNSSSAWTGTLQVDYTYDAVPEPSTWLMLATASVTLLAVRQRGATRSSYQRVAATGPSTGAV